MANKLMYNDDQKISHSVDYNLKRLDTQLNEPTSHNTIKVTRVVKPMNKKTLGTSVINSLMSASSLECASLDLDLSTWIACTDW